MNEKSGAGQLDQAMRQACEERDAAERERDRLREAARALAPVLEPYTYADAEDRELADKARALLEALGDGGQRG